MAAIFATVSNHIRNFWSATSMSQRVFIGALTTIVLAIFIGLVVWISRPEYATLYSHLTPEDADRIVKSLDAQKIPHRLEQDSKGVIVMVPQDKVQNQRIKIAGEKLVAGQGVGFEIFDEAKIGQPEFVQKISYRRALEGELARTMSEFPGVENARVHLVIPNRSLFIEEQQKPSASVLLKLASGRTMDPKDVQAIVNLVTMAVEGLDKSRVSIADNAGKVLFQPDDESSLNGLTRTQFDHKELIQRNLERRIEELLSPVVGVGRVTARVNVDLDFSQKTVRKEIYDPEKTVVRSEMRSEESTQGQASLEGGVPDPNFRGDGPNGTTSTQQATRENRTTNFEINKEEYSIVSSVGAIDRMTVAVIVDGSYEKGADGVMAFKPRTDDELKRIRQLVSNAVGFNSTRGDTIEVSNIAFGITDIDAAPSTASIIADYAVRFGKPMLNALLVFLFLVMIVRPVVLALIRPKVEGKMLEGLEGLPMTEERLALVDEDDEAVAATAMLEKIEDIKAHSLQLSEQNLDQAVGIIRSWLKGAGKASAAPAKAA